VKTPLSNILRAREGPGNRNLQWKGVRRCERGYSGHVWFLRSGRGKAFQTAGQQEPITGVGRAEYGQAAAVWEDRAHAGIGGVGWPRVSAGDMSL
jgi:hypothetical protein